MVRKCRRCKTFCINIYVYTSIACDRVQKGRIKFMNLLILVYLTQLILKSSVVMLAMVLSGIRRAVKQTSWSSEDRNRTFWSVTLVLIGWFAVALVTATLGVYHASSLKTPTIQYALLAPIALGVVLFWRWDLLR